MFRSHIVRKIAGFLLALIILNLSVDPPDLLKNLDADIALEEDISINEMESISEVVLEQVLDIEGAVPESDEEEMENYLKKVEICHPFFSLISIPVEVDVFQEDRSAAVPCFFYDRTLGIHSPPPKG